MSSDPIKFNEYDPNIRDPLVEAALRDFGRDLVKITPPGYGFLVIMAAYGDKEGCFYLSSVQREDAIKLMKEMLERLEK